MANVISDVVSVTTLADQTATAYSSTLNGKLLSISYVKGDFANGVDFTITTEKTLQDLWVDTNIDASETVAPRQPTHSTAGVPSLYASSGEPVEDYIGIAHERIKIAIVAGGGEKSGSFVIVLEGSK